MFVENQLWFCVQVFHHWCPLRLVLNGPSILRILKTDLLHSDMSNAVSVFLLLYLYTSYDVYNTAKTDFFVGQQADI